MNNLSTFTFKSNTIRVIEIEGQPWFVAADVCRVLGLDGYASFHLKKLGADQVAVMTKAANPSLPIFNGRAHQTSVISESGLYRLIMRSDKPEARAFQDWVTRDVLPAIRKDGAYVMGEEKVKTGEVQRSPCAA